MAEEKERGCGSCGTILTNRNRRKGYNSICTDCRMPHMLVTNLGGGQHRCDYCGHIDTYDKLRLSDCGHTQWPPCKDCGGTPYCDPDCNGMAALFADPDTYVIG